MAATIFSIMVVLLLLGFPMMIPLIVGAFVGFYSLFGGFGQLETMVQQMMAASLKVHAPEIGVLELI